MSSAKQAPAADGATRRVKPMVPARKVSLFRREIREWISPPAFEILIGAAEVITEGSFDTTEADDPSFLGSIQIKVPLGSCDTFIRYPLDAAAARRLTQMLQDDEIAQEVLLELAQRETERAAGCALFELQTEIETSHQGDELRISIDVEGLVRKINSHTKLSLEEKRTPKSRWHHRGLVKEYRKRLDEVRSEKV